MLIFLTYSQMMSNLDDMQTNTGNSWLPGLVGLGAAVVLMTAVTGLLHARAALSQDPAAKTALSVSTTRFEIQETYTRQASYLGLVVAGRKATLGFEIPGQIASLPVREGTPISKGQAIAALDNSALQARRRATAADLEQVRTEFELARLKARRQQKLSASGAVSEEAFDETRLRARALASQVEAVEARLASIDIELKKSQLVAPYAGVIADRYVYQGAVVSPGTPVVRLIELADREAHIGVSAALAGTLDVGKRYSLKLRDTRFDAPLLSVRPDVDPMTRAATVVFAVPENLGGLDGEPITLQLEQTVPMAGGWLPIAALLEGQRGVWTVLRVQPDGSEFLTVREAVEVLDIQGERAYVRGTLADSAEVVASGVHRISPGALVSLRQSN